MRFHKVMLTLRYLLGGAVVLYAELFAVNHFILASFAPERLAPAATMMLVYTKAAALTFTCILVTYRNIERCLGINIESLWSATDSGLYVKSAWFYPYDWFLLLTLAGTYLVRMNENTGAAIVFIFAAILFESNQVDEKKVRQ
jgi:hypothetical protein